MATIGRRAYAEMYGPTVGDRLRLADTGLIVEVEKEAAASFAFRKLAQEVKEILTDEQENQSQRTIRRI